jgi:hypothetical protein
VKKVLIYLPIEGDVEIIVCKSRRELQQKEDKLEKEGGHAECNPAILMVVFEMKT